MSLTAAESLADFAGGLEYSDIPTEVALAAKLQFLDTLGVGLAAQSLGLDIPPRGLVAQLGEAGPSTMLGGGQAPAPNAVLVNGVLCHALDFDDTHPASICHVGAAVCPPALAVAESTGASGAELLTALVAGSEIMIRIGLGARLRLHPRGFHPTATCGCFAAAAIAARLIGLDETKTASALGLAGSMASGLFAYLEDGTPTKPIHAGWASHAGISAAILVASGAVGPRSVLEGRFGFYEAYADVSDPDLDSWTSLGRDWALLDVSYKTYPACHILHGPLTALESILAERPVPPDDVKRVVVSLERQHVPFVAEPREAKIAPRTGYEAKFSVQYAIARRLIAGYLGVEHFEADAFRDEPILDLARRIDYEVRSYESYPGSFPGGVRIALVNGDEVEAHALHPRGDPANPASEDDIRSKFRRNARMALTDAAAETLEAFIMTLEEQVSVVGLMPSDEEWRHPSVALSH